MSAGGGGAFASVGGEIASAVGKIASAGGAEGELPPEPYRSPPGGVPGGLGSMTSLRETRGPPTFAAREGNPPGPPSASPLALPADLASPDWMPPADLASPDWIPPADLASPDWIPSADLASPDWMPPADLAARIRRALSSWSLSASASACCVRASSSACTCGAIQ
eukprot:5781595-Pyramimonas_sp.AAC.1